MEVRGWHYVPAALFSTRGHGTNVWVTERVSAFRNGKTPLSINGIQIPDHLSRILVATQPMLLDHACKDLFRDFIQFFYSTVRILFPIRPWFLAFHVQSYSLTRRPVILQSDQTTCYWYLILCAFQGCSKGRGPRYNKKAGTCLLS